MIIPHGVTGDEVAIIKQPAPGVTRVSGVGIRHHLYIGITPDNHRLTVAATKGDLNIFALKLFSPSSLLFHSPSL